MIWASPALPGARHAMGAARGHGILDALTAAGVRVIADNGYRGSGFEVLQRRRPADPETGQRRGMSWSQKAVNSAHAAQRGPGERANAQLKSWKILCKIRCSPRRATDPVKAVMALRPRRLTPSGKGSLVRAARVVETHRVVVLDTTPRSAAVRAASVGMSEKSPFGGCTPGGGRARRPRSARPAWPHPTAAPDHARHHADGVLTSTTTSPRTARLRRHVRRRPDRAAHGSILICTVVLRPTV